MNQSIISRLKTLDSFRGMAALSVVLFHYRIFNYGYLGVHLFFIISGFVIFMSVQKANNPIDFIKNRFSRLYPVYWFSVSLTAISVLLFTNKTISLKVYLSNLTMFQQYMRIPHIDGAYWSLEIELFFYGIIALLLLKKNISRNIEYGLLIVVFTPFLTFFHSNGISLILIILKYSGLFYSGILFYKIWQEGFSYLKFYKILISYLCVIWFNYGSQMDYYYKPFEVFYISICFILFLLFSTKKLKNVKIKPLLFIGKISYSLYLLHEVIGLIILDYLNGCTPYVLLNTTITFIIIVLLSWGVNEFIEIPGSRLLKSRLNR